MSEKLLTTAEAAAFLRASQASLRRWADAGLLPAGRIGRRRARRFREEDLRQFMGRARGEPSPVAMTLPRAVPLRGMSVPVGSHLASLFRSDAGRLHLGLPFLRDGLLANQACLIYATPAIRDQYLEALSKEKVDVAAAIKSGLLVSIPLRRTTVEGWIAELDRLVATASRDHPAPVRFLGEPTTALRTLNSHAAMLTLEQQLTQVVRRMPLVMLCAYDARAFDGVTVMEALELHFDTFDYHLGYFLS